MTIEVSETSGRSSTQAFALVFGVVYVLAAVWGFFVATQFTGLQTDDKVLIFHVNQLHNIVHLIIGVSWVLASRRARSARKASIVIGLVYLVVAVLGFVHPGDLMPSLLNIHSPGDPDNWLHLASSVLAMYFGKVRTG